MSRETRDAPTAMKKNFVFLLYPTSYILHPTPCTHFFYLFPTWVTPVRVSINQIFFSAGAPETVGVSA